MSDSTIKFASVDEHGHPIESLRWDALVANPDVTSKIEYRYGSGHLSNIWIPQSGSASWLASALIEHFGNVQEVDVMESTLYQYFLRKSDVAISKRTSLGYLPSEYVLYSMIYNWRSNILTGNIIEAIGTELLPHCTLTSFPDDFWHLKADAIMRNKGRTVGVDFKYWDNSHPSTGLASQISKLSKSLIRFGEFRDGQGTPSQIHESQVIPVFFPRIPFRSRIRSMVKDTEMFQLISLQYLKEYNLAIIKNALDTKEFRRYEEYLDFVKGILELL